LLIISAAFFFFFEKETLYVHTLWCVLVFTRPFSLCWCHM
jgi:hypothetical protein